MRTGPGALLAEVAERGDLGSLMAAVRDALRAWVGVGPVFLASADPVTGGFTGTYTFDIPDDAAREFYAIESAGRDVVPFAALTGSPMPVGSLYAATHAAPALSERWRNVISPLGWGDELRAAVTVRGSTWGYLCLHREARERPFSPRDLERLGALLPPIAAALRIAALSSRRDSGRLGTGVVLVDHGCRIVGRTGAADAWLEEMGPRLPDGLPLVLAGLTRTILAGGAPVSSTITTRTGRVGVVDAAAFRHTGDPQVAVVISSAPTGQQLDRLAAASGLTARERQIISCVLAGMSTRAIADQLTISPHTVQAHLTSVFSKTALRSRRELIGRLTR